MDEEIEKSKHPRGLAAMSAERRQEIASKGGRTSQARGTAHQWTTEEVSAAGKKGSISHTVQKAEEERVIVESSVGEVQERIYAFLVQYLTIEGMPPTHREIGKAMGLERVSQVERYLSILEQQGRISRPSEKPRNIRLLQGSGLACTQPEQN